MAITSLFDIFKGIKTLMDKRFNASYILYGAVKFPNSSITTDETNKKETIEFNNILNSESGIGVYYYYKPDGYSNPTLSNGPVNLSCARFKFIIEKLGPSSSNYYREILIPYKESAEYYIRTGYHSNGNYNWNSWVQK